MFNVLLTFDDNYVDLGLACINSIVDTRLNSKDNISVNVLCFKDSLSDENIKNLNALSTKNTVVRVIEASKDDEKLCNRYVKCAKQYGLQTHPIVWLRLLAPNYFEKSDTILFMDCDICVRTDIKEFIDNYNAPTQPIIGFNHRYNTVGDINKNSITAAFFVYNLKALDKEKWFKTIEERLPFNRHDEDILNDIFSRWELREHLPQDLICNRVSTQQVPNSMLDNDDYLMYINKRFDEQYRTAEIVHYAGEPKPKFDRTNFTDSLFAFNYLAAKRRIRLKLEKPEPKECVPCKLGKSVK